MGHHQAARMAAELEVMRNDVDVDDPSVFGQYRQALKKTKGTSSRRVLAS